MPIDTLAIARSIIGPRTSISRREMAPVLSALHAAGLDLRNDYVQGTLDLRAPWDSTAGHPQHADAHRAWANACRGITLICVSAAGLRDGYVRYDQPGSMHPQQHCEIMFAPAATAGRDAAEGGGYLAARCELMLAVADDPPIGDDGVREAQAL